MVCADTQVRLTWEAPLKVEVLGSWRSAAEEGVLTVDLGDLVSDRRWTCWWPSTSRREPLISDCALAATVSEARARWRGHVPLDLGR